MDNQDQITPVEIGDGFILRRSSRADLDQLIDFNVRIHHFVPDAEHTISAMTQDLLNGCYPNVGQDCFTLIFEKKTKRIVSAMALIPQTWSYADIPFGVGRPELVGTDPAYRRKGLVRAQFNVFHNQCHKQGLPVQAITGIPFFYRQFGYDLAAPSGGGWMCFTPQELPHAISSSVRSFEIKPITISDLNWIMPAYNQGCKRYLLTCSRNLQEWSFELSGKNDLHIHKKEIRAIFTKTDTPAGFFITDKPFGSVTGKYVHTYEILPDFTWEAVTPAVLQFLYQRGQQDAKTNGGSCGSVGLNLGEEHPAYRSVSHILTHKIDTNAWYVRVPNIPGFLNLILPVMQMRLCRSDLAGYNGDLKISLYDKCFRYSIEHGKITKVAPYSQDGWEDADVAFPYLTFLQILFGFRTLTDLQYTYADCWCKPEKKALVETLFPRLSSNIWGLA